ncbi:MAG TPA: helix-turn-helix domain-containing protein [Candidatus Limnocylindria bacterium]|nr:helix-turn-helix domain-containing protein [Candidatus Limnocylindria bacterium]
MTTRDHARRAAQRFGAGDRGDPVEAGPSLPDRFAAARERKGVDLARAERETKIRVRYLSALERGDYRDLPGAVYTKGFLRNYAIYLGLDPEDVLRQWRRERGDQVGPEPVIVPPRPLDEPSRPLNFSPSVVVAALLTAGVVLFVIYLSSQLLRYSRPPEIAITNPATAVIEVDESTTSFRLAGTSTPGSTVTIRAAGQTQPIRVTTLASGEWSFQVDLRRGQNRFEIDAINPETSKSSETPRTVVITVPFLVIQAPTLVVNQPVEGTTYGNGAIAVEGTTTNATTVAVSAAFLGAVVAEGASPPAPAPAATPGASGGPDPGPTPQAWPNVDVAEDGSFAFPPLELTAGRWAITVTATSTEGKTASLTRQVSVAYSGINVVVNIRGGPAWIKVWIDGQLQGPAGGTVYAAGKTLTFRAEKSVEVRTGSSGSTRFTINGVSLGSLGRPGVPETWLFAPPADPVKTQRQ